MTDKARRRAAATSAPRPSLPPQGVGRSRHRIDGNWGNAKTIFDSELYEVLIEWIDDCIAHSNVKPSQHPPEFDLRDFATEAGLTEPQYEALAMTVEGFSTREVAAFLEVSQTAVQRRMVRLRERIRRFMEAQKVGGVQISPTPSEEGMPDDLRTH